MTDTPERLDRLRRDLAEPLTHPGTTGLRWLTAQLGMACPLCNGKGVVPRGVHDHYASLLKEFNRGHCDGCGNELPLPQEPDGLNAEDRARLEQFFHGGPLYCDGCYDKAPTCDDCGWHIAPEMTAEHYRQAHHN